jgi:site-specific DNA-methyltransferase (adenine-specific)
MKFDNIEILRADNLDYMPSVPDKYFDIGIVDPQYGIKESAHRNLSRTKLAKTKLYKKEFWDYDIPPQSYFDELFRITKHQIIFGINYFLSKRVIPFSSGRIIWDKVNGNSDFSDCEIAYCSFHHSTRLFSFMWNGMMQGLSMENGKIQKGNKSKNQDRIHATEKPYEIYQWIYTKYVKPEYKIIDTNLGSGSHAVEALRFGVSEFVGLEIDQDIFDDAFYRIQSFWEAKTFGYAKTKLNKQYPTLF